MAQTDAEWNGQTWKLNNACPAGAPKHFLSTLSPPDDRWQMANGRWWIANGKGDGGCRADDEWGAQLGGGVGGKNSEPTAQEYTDVPMTRTMSRKRRQTKPNWNRHKAHNRINLNQKRRGRRDMVQKLVTAQGSWGRRPKDDASRSEALRVGGAGYCKVDPSHLA